MDFALTEEQELLQETVRSFVAGECPPQKLREIFDAGGGDDAALWAGIAELGLPGLIVPEEFGGAGLELLDLALAVEVMGSACLPGPFLGHSLACLAIVLGGSAAQKERWLPGLADGSCVGTVALGEPGDRWQPESWTLDGSRDTVTGEKAYVPFGERADLLVVGLAGGGLGVVDRAAGGVSASDQDGIDRSRPIARVEFDGAPCEVLCAGPPGVAAASRLYDAGLVILAADSFGVGVGLLDQCVEYAKTRQQFGFPIAQFQAIKHQLARIGTDLEPTRGLYWYAAHAFDHIAGEARHSAALAKAHITDRAMAAAREAVEIHGGLGFTWECDVQMWFKRAMFNRAFLGTPDVQRERCAALAGW
jgi:alkylation response protein AidB-like acyl-CoA dehydrogenase